MMMNVRVRRPAVGTERPNVSRYETFRVQYSATSATTSRPTVVANWKIERPREACA
jgi:hypothetical protein